MKSIMDILYDIPLVMGTIFILLGAFHGWKLRSVVRRCKIHADGILLGFRAEKTRSGTMYYPVVRFEAKGKTYESEYRFGSTEWEFKKGDKVSIRYNELSPKEIYLYHSLPLWKQYLSPVCIIVGGIIFYCTYYIH